MGTKENHRPYRHIPENTIGNLLTVRVFERIPKHAWIGIATTSSILASPAAGFWRYRHNNLVVILRILPAAQSSLNRRMSGWSFIFIPECQITTQIITPGIHIVSFMAKQTTAMPTQIPSIYQLMRKDFFSSMHKLNNPTRHIRHLPPRATTQRQPTSAQRKEKWRAFTSMF